MLTPSWLAAVLPIATAAHGVALLAAEDDHVLAFGVVALLVAALFLVYLSKRRRLRRERS